VNVRAFAALIGAFAVIGCALMLLLPVHIDSMDMHGSDISCGSVISPDTKDAWAKDRQAVMAGGTSSGNVDDCDESLSGRKVWSVPLGIAGLVILLGAVVVRKAPS
jgi:hypothetical protein